MCACVCKKPCSPGLTAFLVESVRRRVHIVVYTICPLYRETIKSYWLITYVPPHPDTLSKKVSVSSEDLGASFINGKLLTLKKKQLKVQQTPVCLSCFIPFISPLPLPFLSFLFPLYLFSYRNWPIS